MVTLVVQAHPVEISYNGALLDAVLANLGTLDRDHRVVRLGSGDRFEAADLRNVDELIFVYPTWWGSLPAMLLGPLCELIGPWVDGTEARDTSPLRSVERLTVVTSHGSSRVVNRLQGEPGLLLWKRTVRRLCAPGASFSWQALYKLDRLEPAARTTFLERVASSADRG